MSNKTQVFKTVCKLLVLCTWDTRAFKWIIAAETQESSEDRNPNVRIRSKPNKSISGEHIERHLDAPGIPLSRTLIDGHIVKHGPNLNSLSNSESRKRFKASNTKVQSRTKKRPGFRGFLEFLKSKLELLS